MKRLIPKSFYSKAAQIMAAVLLVIGISGSLQAGSLASPPMFITFNRGDTEFWNTLLCSAVNLSQNDLFISIKIINDDGTELASDVLLAGPGMTVIMRNTANSFSGFNAIGYCRFDVLNGPASSVKASACDFQHNHPRCIHYLEATAIPSGRINRVPDDR